MNLVYLCNEYPPAPHGGIGTSVQTLARGLAARGHSVTVAGVYSQPKSLESRDGDVRVIRLPASRVPKVGWLLDRLALRRHLKGLAAAGSVDLVEATDWQGGAWPAVGQVPTIVRFHGSGVTFNRLVGRGSARISRWVEQQALRVADGHVASSRFIARETAADFGLQEDRIPVIPNFIDPERFSPPQEGVREEGLVVCIGTVTEKKGVVPLIEAWPGVVERCPCARLAVVGRDGRHLASGRSMIAVLREMLPAAVAPTVTFTDAVPHPEVNQWLERAALAVYPTFVEAMPLVWLEAMATATPVLGSCLGPGEEMIEDGRSGLLCDPRSPAELASRIVELLRDPALRARLGSAGRQRVLERFSPEIVLPQNEDLYRRYVLRDGTPGFAGCVG